MLPPITGPAVTVRPTPVTTDAAQNATQGARTSLTQASAERGPAQMRAETVRAVEPVRQSSPSERLRSSGPDGSDLKEALPAGPPPAFVETLLERQARQVFDPPETGAPKGPEAPEDPLDETEQPRKEAMAKAGFEEARAMSGAEKTPEVDRKE